jgi:hypothetical protein
MMQQCLAASTKAATDAAATVPPEEVVIDTGATMVLSSLLPGTATKRKKDRKRWNRILYQNKKNKMIGLFSLPAVMKTTMQAMTMQTTTKMKTTTKTMTKMTTTTALCSDDHWALNANGTMRTPLAQRVAKCRQVEPAVDGILHAGNAVKLGALLRGVLNHPSMFSAQ